MTQLHPRLEHPAPLAPEHGAGFDAIGRAAVAELGAVDSRLDAFFAERIARSIAYGDGYERLWRGARDAADGGKRLRPRFVLAAFGALDGGSAEGALDAALDTAVAFELLHTAFLLHDDVIDGDTTRRGRLNLLGEFRAQAARSGADEDRAQRLGETAAILAGDLLLHAAASLVARLEVAAPVRERLLDVLDHSLFVTAAGELADVGLATGTTAAGLPEVLRMTERKTAAYSVTGPLQAGALLAGASDDLLAVLADYGRLVGLAFQLGDDLLGVYGHEEATGKSVVSDLREGKETSLIAYARSTDAWPRIAPSLGSSDLGAAEAASLAAALEECGARRFVEELLDDHVAAALDTLRAGVVPPALAAELGAVARSCSGRLS